MEEWRLGTHALGPSVMTVTAHVQLYSPPLVVPMNGSTYSNPDFCCALVVVAAHPMIMATILFDRRAMLLVHGRSERKASSRYKDTIDGGIGPLKLNTSPRYS